MKKIGSIVLQVVMNRWFLLAIGLLCISALIWFLGPLVVIGDMVPFESGVARLLTIFMLVVLWSANNLLIFYLDRRRSNQIASDLSVADATVGATPGQDDVEREISAMAMGFEHAVRVLKRVNGRGIGDKRYLYQTPWYLTLGAAAAGKTTALRNAGLGFSLIKPRDLPSWQAQQQNRYCQWWLCDNAVVVDTAGRHTGHDDNPTVDRLAWQKLLTMLRKYRPRRPVNGVILFVSMVDLIDPESDVCTANADAVRQRLQELCLEFKCPIPVYCLVSKCDQVAGFVEFFGNLARKDNDQVWGITFDFAKNSDLESPVELFGAKFDQLTERLQTRMIDHLEYEADLERRARIQEFPTQMQLLRQSLHDHLFDIFKPRRFDGQIELRGVYFTSATQMDAPGGRLALFLTSIFGFAAQPLQIFAGATSGFFLKSLFKDVIFRESNLSVFSADADRRHRLVQHAVAAAALITLFVTGFAWLISFNRNQDYISSVEARVTSFNQQSGVLAQDIKDIRSPLPVLDLLRKMPGGYAEQGQSTPLAGRLGLSQRDKLGTAASAAYQRVLQSTLLPRLIYRLEQQIKDSFNNAELLRAALKVYLMLEDPTRFHRETVGLWYDIDVERWLPGEANGDRRGALRNHLDALFEQQLAPPPPDTNLVGSARRILAATPVAQSAYARIKAEALAGTASKGWILQRQLGRVSGRVFDPASTPTVPAFYTVAVYREAFPKISRRVVKDVIDNTWVIGLKKLDGRSDALHDQVVDLYLADYAEHWDKVLKGTRLVRLSSLQQASQVLNDLIGDNAMLRRFFVEVGKQTRLVEPVDKGVDPTAKIKNAANAAKRLPGAGRVTGRLSRLTAIVTGGDAETVKSDRAQFINKRYARVHSLVEPGADGTLKIDALAAQLKEFGEKLKAIAKRGYFPQQANWEDIDVDIALPAIRQVDPLHAWVMQITEQIKTLSGGRTRQRIDAKWNAKVGSACAVTLAKSYPFKSDSQTDLPLAEFSRFFAPKGLFDKFFKENLEGLIDTSSRPWKAQSDGTGNALVSRKAVRMFEQAALIRSLFFAQGAEPQYSFVMVPVSLDGTASKFQLEVGNQRITYRHGPARSWQITWPGQDAIQGARAVFTTFQPGNPTAALVMRGVWGWFRMMERFRVRSKANLIQFDVKNFKAIYKFDTSNTTSLPSINLFKTFRCLKRL